MLYKSMVMERDYPDCRCMLLELSATLDRYDRAAATEGTAAVDARLKLLQQCLAVLAQPSARPDRTPRILELLSNPA